MRKSKVKKENPPARLLGTMSLLVLVLVLVFAALPWAFTLWWSSWCG